MADQMTLEQFGQSIKDKHPEYADLQNSDLAQKVLAKYPQYGDMVQQPELIKANAAQAKQGIAGQSQALDQYQQDNSFLPALLRRGANEVINAPGAAASDLASSVKGIGQMAAPPKTAGDYAAFGVGPGGMFMKRAAEGYMNATQQNLANSRQEAEQGKGAESAISTAAAALPVVGPLIGGVKEAAQNEEGLGTGLSRAGQLMAMAPEGSPVRAPLDATVSGATKVAGGAAKLAGLTPEGMMRPVLNAAPKAFRFGKDPVGFVVDNKIGGGSFGEVADNVGQALQPKIADLTDTLAKSKATVDLQPTADMLKQAIGQAKAGRNVPLADQLTKFYEQRFGGNQPMKVPAQDAAAIKRGIQDSINWQGEGDAVSKIKMQLQHQLGDDLHQAVPGSAALDEEISSGIEAQKAANAQALREEAGKPTGG
ncbi:MAG: hypothetical protein EPN91_00775, partial [Salinibacterium sp.]